MRKLFLILLLAMMPVLANFSDVVKGTVKDENGQPLQTKIKFTDEYGESFDITSDAQGNFSGAVFEGKNYLLSIKGYLIHVSSQKLIVPSNNVFNEHHHNVVAQKLTSGINLFEANYFEKGSAKFTTQSEKILKRIREDISEHNIKIKLLLTCEDSKLKESELKSLLENRKKAILMQLFKYNLANTKIFVEIAERVNSSGNILVQVY